MKHILLWDTEPIWFINSMITELPHSTIGDGVFKVLH